MLYPLSDEAVDGMCDWYRQAGLGLVTAKNSYFICKVPIKFMWLRLSMSHRHSVLLIGVSRASWKIRKWVRGTY